MLRMNRLLIIGCGDVVKRALPWLTQRFRVYATVRSRDDAAMLRRWGVTPIQADLDRPDSLRRLAGLGHYVIHSAPPAQTGREDRRTRHLIATLSRAGILPRHLVYISTTGVYGDCQGAWVDETRTCRPQSPRAARRVDAERQLRHWGQTRGCAVTVLRAPGIYAANRLPLERLQRGDPVLCAADDVYTNHIHADDLGRLSALALFKGRPNRCYNACDSSSLLMGEWYTLLAQRFQLPPPPRLSRDAITQHLSPLTLSFMSESRRLSNQRLLKEWRIGLRYPTVAQGLASMT